MSSTKVSVKRVREAITSLYDEIIQEREEKFENEFQTRKKRSWLTPWRKRWNREQWANHMNKEGVWGFAGLLVLYRGREVHRMNELWSLTNASEDGYVTISAEDADMLRL